MKYGFVMIAALVTAVLAAGVAQAAEVSGLIYHDAGDDARSYYEQDLGDGDKFLPDVDVYLLSGEDERHAVTNADGGFLFGGVEPGTYLLDVGITPDHACTSHNRSLRAPQAVREGAIHIVSIGDSIGVMGSDRPYPVRLAEHFEALADTTLDNLAVGGSTSWQWLPGADSGYFDERLAPVLPDADVLTVTLGGNDFEPYLPPGDPPYDIWALIQNFLAHPEYFLDMIPNVKGVMEAAHDVNPDCDVVYVVYPNFGNSTYIMNYIGDFQPLASIVVGTGMRLFRWAMGEEAWIVLGDMYGALGSTWLDPYLLDGIHPNDAGHQYYADVIFLALGGAVIGDGGMGEQRLFGFDAPDLAPVDDDTATDDTADDTVDDDTGGDDTASDDTADDASDDDISDDATPDDTGDDAVDDSAPGDDASAGDDDGSCGC